MESSNEAALANDYTVSDAAATVAAQNSTTQEAQRKQNSSRYDWPLYQLDKVIGQ